jgi:hypothetical protein
LLSSGAGGELVGQRRLDPALVHGHDDGPELLRSAVQCVLSTAYTSTPTRSVIDSGPDNIRGTSDDRNLAFYDVKPEFVGKGHFSTPTAATTCRSMRERYKALELSIGKRMSNAGRCRAPTCGLASTASQLGLTTTTTAAAYDYTNPNNLLDYVGRARQQRPAARLQDPRQLPGAVGASTSARTIRR